jgi:hypothetical protein
MLGKLWARVKAHIVEDVPDDMSACLDCEALQCRDDQYETCPRRLIRAADLGKMRLSDDHQTVAADGELKV